MFFQLVWTDSRGRGCIEHSANAGRLLKKLETIRCEAELWALDATGNPVEKIGGCERCDHADDKRIKWNWWYDKTAFLTLEDLITAGVAA
jgi:hypothetical protein